MKNFRTFQLAVTFYAQVRSVQIPGHLKSQLLRAAQSIGLNLAEGRGRASKSEQHQFFNIAMGSLRECQAVFILEGLQAEPAWATLDALGASLYCLLRAVR